MPLSMICECWNSNLQFEQIKIQIGMASPVEVTVIALEAPRNLRLAG
jgi:hypothetical protein